MTYFFDLDGTILKYHKNEWIEDAKKTLIQLLAKGHKLVFMTMRGPQDKSREWSVENTKKFFLEEGFQDVTILFGISKPRIFVDDDKNFMIKKEKDSKLEL